MGGSIKWGTAKWQFECEDDQKIHRNWGKPLFFLHRDTFSFDRTECSHSSLVLWISTIVCNTLGFKHQKHPCFKPQKLMDHSFLLDIRTGDENRFFVGITYSSLVSSFYYALNSHLPMDYNIL